MKTDNTCELCGNTEEVELGLCSTCYENAPMGEWFNKVRDTIQCPIGIDVGDPHTYVQGTGRLAFMDIMGLPGNIREVCLTCAHPSNMPVVDGGLELAPDMRVYTVLVDGVNYNDHILTAQEATDIAYGWQIAGSENVVIEISPKSSQESLYQSELAELTHRTQVAIFGWCGCEDNAGNENPYADCPITPIID